MKKYLLAILTIIVLLVSAGLYIDKGYGMDVSQYQKAMVPLEIEELGDIIDMGWFPYYHGENNDQLYILAQKEIGNRKTNILYQVDLDKESIEVLYEYKPHPALDNFIHIDINYGFLGPHIVLLTEDSVVNLSYHEDQGTNDLVFAEPEYYYFNNFHRITSFVYGYDLLYTVLGERVFYRNSPRQSGSFFDFFTNPQSLNDTKYLNLTDKVIASNRGDIYYTQKVGNNTRFFRQFEKNRSELVTEYLIDYTVNDAPVILTKGSEGFYLEYELFYVNEKKAISSNTDKLGYSTSFSAAKQKHHGLNKIIYTEFDEDGLGSLNLLTAQTGKDDKWRWVTTTNVETLIEKQPIVGKVCLSSEGDKVIYFKLENGEIRVKKLIIATQQETDITEIFR